MKNTNGKNDDTAAKRQKNRRSEIYLSVPAKAAAAPAEAVKPAADKPAEPANAEKPVEKEAEKPVEAVKPADNAENPATP